MDSSSRDIAGIPLSALPAHVKAALNRPLSLEIAISADAIFTVLGDHADLAIRQVPQFRECGPSLLLTYAGASLTGGESRWAA